jgi:hypothetical protein
MVDSLFSTVSSWLTKLNVPAKSEADLQQKIEPLLAAQGFVREVEISGGRADFWNKSEGVVIETKVTCSVANLLRQLKKYAAGPEVKELWVVSVRPFNLPDSLSGKKVRGIFMWKAAMA